jgi:GTP-binding protein
MKDSWKPLIESYLSNRTTLAGVLLLIDIRRGPEVEELDFVPWLAQRNVPLVVAMTKGDKLPKNKRNVEVMRARQALSLTRDPFAVSTLTADGIDEVWRSLIKIVLPAPK